MLVGLSVFELHLPYSQSLKEKRKVVKGMVDRLHDRYRVSVIESDFHDLHQRAQIAVAYLSSNERELHRMSEELRKIADEEGEAVVSDWDDHVLEAMD